MTKREDDHSARLVPAAETHEGEPQGAPLEAFLPVPEAAPEARRAPTGMRSARLLSVAGRVAIVSVRGEDQPSEVPLDPDVDASIVLEAMETGERVLVEADEEGGWVVVGVLRSRRPETLRLVAESIEIEADREVLLRSGSGAMRIRQDGEIEVVGSRISAASRGLFRLVGRMLRLN